MLNRMRENEGTGRGRKKEVLHGDSSQSFSYALGHPDNFGAFAKLFFILVQFSLLFKPGSCLLFIDSIEQLVLGPPPWISQ